MLFGFIWLDFFLFDLFSYKCTIMKNLIGYLYSVFLVWLNYWVSFKCLWVGRILWFNYLGTNPEYVRFIHCWIYGLFGWIIMFMVWRNCSFVKISNSNFFIFWPQILPTASRSVFSCFTYWSAVGNFTDSYAVSKSKLPTSTIPTDVYRLINGQ